jgi:hypothetical protein
LLSIHDLRRVSWRRQSATQEYAGYVAITDDGIRLIGREDATGIDATLTIPHAAILAVRVDGAGLALDVADGVVILVRPLAGDLVAVAGRIARAPRPPADPAPARDARALPGSRAAASA